MNNFKKITKKDFKQLHENKRIRLLQGMVKVDKKDIQEKIDKLDYNKLLDMSIELSRCNIEGKNINIYQCTNIIYVENITNSKWHGNQTFNTIYLILK